MIKLSTFYAFNPSKFFSFFFLQNFNIDFLVKRKCPKFTEGDLIFAQDIFIHYYCYTYGAAFTIRNKKRTSTQHKWTSKRSIESKNP